jgi:hypothetical protein
VIRAEGGRREIPIAGVPRLSDGVAIGLEDLAVAADLNVIAEFIGLAVVARLAVVVVIAVAQCIAATDLIAVTRSVAFAVFNHFVAHASFVVTAVADSGTTLIRITIAKRGVTDDAVGRVGPRTLVCVAGVTIGP